MFVDSAIITVRAGHGGAGHVSFRRQKYEPKGGPSGGDGGRGGDVILQAEPGMNTLLDFRGRPLWEATPGTSGAKKQQTGGDGPPCIIRVPAGTLVYDDDSGDLIVDMAPGQSFLVCHGGNGGFGNEHYKTAVTQAPTHAHPGFPGEEKRLRLELKLLADVGLVGLPNAGKSTLLAALTRATPKIADYPFTTLAPQLGVAELDATRRIVIADIPGLIEGASHGAGLGTDFLRHIERTRVLVHLLDALPPDGTRPSDNYKLIRNELYTYSPVLAEREEVIVLNKLDLLEDDAARQAAVGALRAELKLGRDVEVIGISGAARMNTRALLEKLWHLVKVQEKRWEGVAPPPEAAGKPAPEPLPVPARPRPPAAPARAAEPVPDDFDPASPRAGSSGRPPRPAPAPTPAAPAPKPTRQPRPAAPSIPSPPPAPAPASKPAPKAPARPAPKPAKKSAKKTAPKPAKTAAKKQAKKPAKKSVKKQAAKPAKKPTKKTATRAAKPAPKPPTRKKKPVPSRRAR